jgi:hypothetical protein
MFDMHYVFTTLGILFGIPGYYFYFKSIFARETKPHVFTWFVYAVIDGIIAIAQLISGGGIGSLVVSLAAIANGVIAVLAYWYGEKHIRTSDWVCLAGALFAIILWIFMHDALYAVIVSSGRDTRVGDYLRPLTDVESPLVKRRVVVEG